MFSDRYAYKKGVVIGTALGVVISSIAIAGYMIFGNRNISVEAADKLMSRASGGDINVTETFMGPDGFTGAVLSVRGQKSLGWIAPGGNIALIGQLFDHAGTNYTQMALVSHGIMPPTSPAKDAVSASNATGPTMDASQAARLAKAAPGVLQGDGGPVIQVFYDPNCVFCHHYYQSLQSAILAKRLRVHWIPVAILKPSSVGRAAAILGATDQAKAMMQNDAGYNDRDEEGGIAAAKPSPEILAEINANNDLLNGAAGRLSTPTTILMSAGKWVVVPGQIPVDRLLQAVAR